MLSIPTSRPCGLRPTVAFLVAAIALVAAPRPTPAQTTTPPPPKVYRACYTPSTGTVYRIGEAGQPASCAKSTHIEFSWNTEGPQGPQGEKGLSGEKGDAGPAGLKGDA